MEKLNYRELNETLYRHRLDNGLEVFILPKAFNKTHVTFTTKYGSIDNYFRSSDHKEWIQVPSGIAHFLEHKMFEMPDGTDVFQQFGRQGAQANAFTTFNRTTYLFSTTSEVEKNTETLLDFVQTPAWTDESVEKEKGIIGQEIQMYNDNPDWRVYYGLIANMYKNHPVRTDIAGTVSSISQITKDLLYTCYRTFYHPSNMVLFVTGPVDPDAMVSLILDNQTKKQFKPITAIERHDPDEPSAAAKTSALLNMDVGTPKCLIGFKEKNPRRSGEDLMRHELSVSLLLEMLFGRGSDNYQKLMEEKLIDESFSFDFTEEYTFGFSIIGGNTDQPKRLIERLREMIEQLRQGKLAKEILNRAKKKQIGSMLRAFNSLAFIANQFSRYRFNGMDLFHLINQLEQLSVEDLEATLADHFSDECFTSFTVSK